MTKLEAVLSVRIPLWLKQDVEGIAAARGEAVNVFVQRALEVAINAHARVDMPCDVPEPSDREKLIAELYSNMLGKDKTVLSLHGKEMHFRGEARRQGLAQI